MNLKPLGSTGIRVSELVLGTWRYRGGVEPLRAGLELGACFLDTAESYGTETTVGEAIRGMRDRVFVASKVSPRHFRYKDVIKAAEFSLKQIGTDYLDLYQLHWPNYAVPIAETMSAMERLVEMGKIRFIGVSNFSVQELDLAQRQLTRVRIVSNQVNFSLVHRDPEKKLIPYCEANEISLLAYSPLASGPDALTRADGGDVLGRVGALVDKTRAQVALNWCIMHPCVIAIFKADKLEHVRENCGASGWHLNSEQLKLLSQSVRPSQNRGAAERFARRLARHILHRMGRNLGTPTAMDLTHGTQPDE